MDMRYNKKSSSDIAVERLKLVLIHDRMGTSPSGNLIANIKRDIIEVLSRYAEIDEENFDVEVLRAPKTENTYQNKLVANIPIKRIKHNG